MEKPPEFYKHVDWLYHQQDETIANLRAQLAIERKALELACEDTNYWRDEANVISKTPDYFRQQAQKEK